MSIAFTIQSIVGRILGVFFAFVVLLNLLYRNLKSPLEFIKVNVFKTKRRHVMPACLKDPSLGEHNYAHLEVSKLTRFDILCNIIFRDTISSTVSVFFTFILHWLIEIKYGRVTGQELDKSTCSTFCVLHFNLSRPSKKITDKR